MPTINNGRTHDLSTSSLPDVCVPPYSRTKRQRTSGGGFLAVKEKFSNQWWPVPTKHNYEVSDCTRCVCAELLNGFVRHHRASCLDVECRYSHLLDVFVLFLTTPSCSEHNHTSKEHLLFIFSLLFGLVFIDLTNVHVMKLKYKVVLLLL